MRTHIFPQNQHEPDRKFETIKRTIDSMDFYKKCITIYIVAVILAYVLASYNTGKEALLDYRRNQAYGDTGEWKAVKNQVYATSYANMMDSVFLHCRVMPSIVLALNPPSKHLFPEFEAYLSEWQTYLTGQSLFGVCRNKC